MPVLAMVTLTTPAEARLWRRGRGLGLGLELGLGLRLEALETGSGVGVGIEHPPQSALLLPSCTSVTPHARPQPLIPGLGCGFMRLSPSPHQHTDFLTRYNTFKPWPPGGYSILPCTQGSNPSLALALTVTCRVASLGLRQRAMYTKRPQPQPVTLTPPRTLTLKLTLTLP